MGASSSSHVAAPYRLETEDLPSLRLLGKGLSGFVYETACQGRRCARKDFPVGSSKLDIFTEEVSRLRKLEHRYVVKCIGYVVGKSSCSLVLEYVEADLQSEMQRRIETNIEKSTSPLSIKSTVTIPQSEGSSSRDVPENSIPLRFDTQEAVDLISQLAASMKYLHDNGIAHGDLKPKNVLLDCSQSGKMIVKVADFGLVETKKQIKLVSKRTRHFEVLTWRAPELFLEYLGPPTDDPFTDSDTEQVDEGIIGSSDNFLQSKLAMADVYSFGLTCSYIFGGQLFFPGLSLTQLRERKQRNFMPVLHPTCPDPLKKLIYSSLNSVPERRPTFSAICSHEALLLQLPPSAEENEEMVTATEAEAAPMEEQISIVAEGDAKRGCARETRERDAREADAQETRDAAAFVFPYKEIKNPLYHAALSAWDSKEAYLGRRVDRLEKASADLMNQIYNIIGFFSVFQGVVLTVVKQFLSDSFDTCGLIWYPLVLSSVAAAISIAGVSLKFSNLRKLQSSIHSEKAAQTEAAKMATLFRGKIRGKGKEKFRFEEYAKNSHGQIEKLKSSHFSCFFVVLFLCVFTVLIIRSHFAILCDSSVIRLWKGGLQWP